MKIGTCKFHKFNLGGTVKSQTLSRGFQIEFFESTYELGEVTAVPKRGLALNLTKLFILPW